MTVFQQLAFGGMCGTGVATIYLAIVSDVLPWVSERRRNDAADQLPFQAVLTLICVVLYLVATAVAE